MQGIASILRDLVVSKVINNPTDLCNISQENSQNLKDLANSINLDQILSLQSKLKGSENYIRHSNQPKLWLEIHLLGMLADEDQKENSRTNQSFNKTTVSNTSDNKNINHTSENKESNINKEIIKPISIEEEHKTSTNISLDKIWEKVIAMLELPSTKMLLSQQAKLINLHSDTAEIAISGKWINMIQSRKNLIEDAFYKARGVPTKVILIQQKDNAPIQKKDESKPSKIETKNEFKIDKEPKNNNSDKTSKMQIKNNLETNSIDQKAKQFADFFNGEVVNIE